MNRGRSLAVRGVNHRIVHDTRCNTVLANASDTPNIMLEHQHQYQHLYQYQYQPHRLCQYGHRHHQFQPRRNSCVLDGNGSMREYSDTDVEGSDYDTDVRTKEKCNGDHGVVCDVCDVYSDDDDGSRSVCEGCYHRPSSSASSSSLSLVSAAASLSSSSFLSVASLSLKMMTASVLSISSLSSLLTSSLQRSLSLSLLSSLSSPFALTPSSTTSAVPPSALSASSPSPLLSLQSLSAVGSLPWTVFSKPSSLPSLLLSAPLAHLSFLPGLNHHFCVSHCHEHNHGQKQKQKQISGASGDGDTSDWSKYEGIAAASVCGDAAATITAANADINHGTDAVADGDDDGDFVVAATKNGGRFLQRAYDSNTITAAMRNRELQYTPARVRDRAGYRSDARAYMHVDDNQVRVYDMRREASHRNIYAVCVDLSDSSDWLSDAADEDDHTGND